MPIKTHVIVNRRITLEEFRQGLLEGCCSLEIIGAERVEVETETLMANLRIDEEAPQQVCKEWHVFPCAFRGVRLEAAMDVNSAPFSYILLTTSASKNNYQKCSDFYVATGCIFHHFNAEIN
jgi:hypothetical protein